MGTEKAEVVSGAPAREEKPTLEALADSLPVAVIGLDRQHRVTHWSKAAERLFGYKAEEIVGRTYPIVPDEQWPAFEVAFRRALAGEPQREVSVPRKRKDGQIRTVSGSAAPLASGAGRVIGVVYALEDESEKMNATRDRTVQAQKMEAVGQLAGGIAHDFNNLLTVIIGNVEAMMLTQKDQPVMQQLGEAVLRAAERGASLNHRLLAFARRQVLEPASIDFNQLVRDTETLVRRTIGEDIEITLELSPETPYGVADAAQLENALLNLVVNARHAMPDGGTLAIGTDVVELDITFASQDSELAPGPYAALSVADTGSGMTPEVARRAFEPFFTTKEVGKGSGLGLSQIFGFMKQSKGHVTIDSEVGRGTTVRLYLPQAAERAITAPGRGGGPGEAMPQGTETVLVVEDDEGLRKSVASQLESLGYTVVSAADGPAALALIERMGPVDLLFTDVILPHGMAGPAIAQALREKQSSMRVLYTSGYSEDELSGEAKHAAGAPLLAKPYRKADLARMVRLALDG